MSNILTTLLTSIKNMVSSIRPPFPEIPSFALVCNAKSRSGLSAMAIGTGIISRLPDIGIPNGVNDDGTENLINKYSMLVAEEVVKEIKNNGLTMVGIGPQDLKLSGFVTVGEATVPCELMSTQYQQLRGINA